MSDSNPNPIPRRRWLAWQAGEPIMADSAGNEPTKPSEPGFDGFDGSSSARLAKIDGPPREPNAPSAPVPSPQMSIISAVDSPTATERVMSWAEWKAAVLNQLFLDLGSTGQPGRITADTIRHGEQAWMTNRKNRDAESQKPLRPE